VGKGEGGELRERAADERLEGLWKKGVGGACRR
jgi:hypothetical protein